MGDLLVFVFFKKHSLVCGRLVDILYDTLIIPIGERKKGLSHSREVGRMKIAMDASIQLLVLWL